MSISAGSSPYNTCYEPQSFNLGAMVQKAYTYARGNDHLLNHILAILENQEFKSDPKLYLNLLTRSRKHIIELRAPEDQALAFFSVHLKFQN